MKRSQIVHGLVVVAIAAVGARLPLRESEPLETETIVADPSSAPMESSSAPVASSAAIEEPPAPPTEPAFCRRAISPGFTLAQVPDATLRDLILGGAPGKKSARDCLGAKVEYENAVAPHVTRYDLGDGKHMAVFVMLAKEPGYTEWCPGFAGIVRLEPDAVVIEGVGPEQIDDNDMTKTLRLATIDGKRALLFPHVMSTGEEGDFEAAWKVWLPDDRGALKSVGYVRSMRSMGNGSMSSGQWFGSMEATVLDGGALQAEERWDFVRYNADGGEDHGKKRTLIRTYSLQRGKLVASPKNDPTQ